MISPEDISYGPRQRDDHDASTVGIVEEVSANRIEVGIVREAPHGTALRSGLLLRFPRINSYVVIPSEYGNLLALIVWIGIEVDRTFEKRHASDLIGLPIPRRRLRAIPLGRLRYTNGSGTPGHGSVSLDRGGLHFPTVGDPVRLPTPNELSAAVPQLTDDQLAVPIGQAVLADNASVSVDPNRLFGRHLAVLGNTGSGKSCSLVYLLRSTISSVPNLKGFKAVILDPNGEYAAAFDDLATTSLRVRHFTVRRDNTHSEQFRVPYWLWNYREWLSFTEASPRAQAPQLRRCLHLLRTTQIDNLPTGVNQVVIGRYVVGQFLSGLLQGYDKSRGLSELENVMKACGSLEKETEGNLASLLGTLRSTLENSLNRQRGSRGYRWEMGAGLDVTECKPLVSLFDEVLERFGVTGVMDDSVMVDDLPEPFDARRLINLLPLLAIESESAKWIAPMVERLRIALTDETQASICGWREGEDLMKWLHTYAPVGASNEIAIVDLSLIPSHILHTVVAVFVRVLLESMQRHHRLGRGLVAPRMLVVDEAHGLMSRGYGVVSDDQIVTPTRLCRESFERVAREGRKFGLSLVIASQRPADLSETVLSQCNTFLLHRIVNERDQRFVQRLMPDSLGGMVEELPALPGQTGLLVGWAADIPALVRVHDLDAAHQPKSSDPDFAGLWQGKWNTDVGSEAVVGDWTSSRTTRSGGE